MLVNGQPGNTIACANGLRQVDPISPMLFILAMEALHHIFCFPARQNLITPLGSRGLTGRLSLFADDVMIFLKPVELDVLMCKAILDDFGVASGLRINPQKCTILSIRCSPEDVDLLTTGLGCPIGSFPWRYLGLPLCLRKAGAAQFQDLVDIIARKLPTRRAAALDKSARLIVQSVLCAMPIHTMMTLDVSPAILARIRKICRGFLWAGRAHANGGNCVVVWDTVCTPKWAGGLGPPDMHWLNVALGARWLWLKRLRCS